MKTGSSEYETVCKETGRKSRMIIEKWKRLVASVLKYKNAYAILAGKPLGK
jgi:hypothetical protein